MISCVCKKKEDKNQAILKAAEFEFLEKGLELAAMESIAKTASVSKATLYKYYRTKELLFEQLVTTLFSEVDDALSYPYDSGLSIEELFSKVVDTKLKLLTDPHFINLARILIVEEMRKPEMKSKLKERFHQSKRHFIEWAKKCQRDKLLPSTPPPKEISEWFHALFDGMILWPIMMGVSTLPTKKEQQRFKRIITDSFLKTYCR